MSLPFTQQQFFEVMSRYNEAVAPLQIGLVLLALSAFGAMVVRRRDSDRVISAILAALWAWMGIVYHFMYFQQINPAAGLFGIVFLAAAAIFAWTGVVRGRLVFDCESRARRIAGHALIAYSLVGYPVLSAMLGREFPEIPTFGLPCPTTIFTLGMLAFLARPFPRYVFAIPIGWSLIGSQAAFLLGVHEDLGLLVAAIAGLWLAFDLPICTSTKEKAMKGMTRRSMEAEMRELGRRLDKLAAAMRRAGADAKARSRVQLRKLKAQQAAAQQALRRLGRQSAAASGPLKAGVRKAWRDIDSAVRRATQRFRHTA